MASLDLGGGDFADPSLVPISRFSVSFLSKCPLAAPISFQDKEQVEFTVKPEEDLILEGTERVITRVQAGAFAHAILALGHGREGCRLEMFLRH